MIRGPLAGLAAAACAVALTGCGATSPPNTTPLSLTGSLCIYVGAATGPRSEPAAGSLLAGVRAALAAAGGRGGPFALRVCGVHDRPEDASGGAEAAAQAAERATATPSTILFVGDVTPAATAVSSRLLSAAAIPQIAPVAPATPTDVAGSTLLVLKPSPATVAAAVRQAAGIPGCRRVVRLRPAGAATVAASSPATGTGTTRASAGLPALGTCVIRFLGGPRAAGEAAVEMLVTVLRRLGREGAERAAVLSGLSSEQLPSSALGVLAFSGTGYLGSGTFGVYRRVGQRLALVQTVQIR